MRKIVNNKFIFKPIKQYSNIGAQACGDLGKNINVHIRVTC